MNFCRHQCFTSFLSTGNRVQRSSEGMRVFSFELEHSAFSVFLPRIITALLASNLLNELGYQPGMTNPTLPHERLLSTWTFSQSCIFSQPRTLKRKKKRNTPNMITNFIFPRSCWRLGISISIGKGSDIPRFPHCPLHFQFCRVGFL